MAQTICFLQELVYKQVFSHCMSTVLMGTLAHLLFSNTSFVSIIDIFIFSVN